MFGKHPGVAVSVWSGRRAFHQGMVAAAALLILGGGHASASESDHAAAADLLKDSGYELVDDSVAASSVASPWEETLAGSGYEADGVVSRDFARNNGVSAATSSYEDVLAGSGYEQAPVGTASAGDPGPTAASASYEDLLARAGGSSASADRGTWDGILANVGYA